MDLERFDNWTRTIARRFSRRGVCGMLLGGLIACDAMADASARKKKRRKKRKKGKNGPNTGRPCKERCPSGCCTGEKGDCLPGTIATACGGQGNVCRICGEKEICRDRRCCRGTYQSCMSDDECCEPWICGDETGKQLCCAPNGYAPLASAVACCSPYDVPEGGPCCRAHGLNCSQGTLCCGQNVCAIKISEKELKCCLPTGAICDNGSECCSDVCASAKCL